MTETPEVDFIFGGPAKTATTWIHECLQSHPSVAVPESDSVGYFDINYHRQWDWYEEQLASPTEDAIRGDISEGYLPSEKAPRRIAEAFPDITLLFCIRNPIRRAFSHWWHGYGKGYHEYELDNVFRSFASYQWWIQPGFYADHIERYERHFSSDQIHLLFFDDLKEDNEAFIQDVFETLGVDDEFVPPIVGETSNEATFRGPAAWMDLRNWLRRAAPTPLKRALLEPAYHTVRPLLESRSKYEAGVPPEIRSQLEAIYRDDVRRLEEKTGRDLDHWFETD